MLVFLGFRINNFIRIFISNMFFFPFQSDNFSSTTVRICMFCDTSHTTTSVSNRCCLADSLMVPNNTRYQISIPTVAKSAQCLGEEAIHNNNSKKTSIHVAGNFFLSRGVKSIFAGDSNVLILLQTRFLFHL